MFSIGYRLSGVGLPSNKKSENMHPQALFKFEDSSIIS